MCDTATKTNPTPQLVNINEHKEEFNELVDKLFQRDFIVHGTVYNMKKLGWVFKLSKTKRAIAQCYWNGAKKLKGIKFSVYYLNGALDWELVEQTLLHEIAHAIDYERRGDSDHGYKWKYICQEIGYTGKRTTDVNHKKLDFKYLLKCPQCKKDMGGFHRKPKRSYYHTDCQPSKYNFQYPLEVTQQY